MSPLGWLGAGRFLEEEDLELLSNKARQRVSSLLQPVVSRSHEMINSVGRSGKRGCLEEASRPLLE